MSPVFNILLLLILILVIGIPAIGQKNSRPSFEQADSAFVQHDYKNARIYYKQLLTDTSHDALHLNRLGYSAYSIGNHEEAEKYYRRALLAGPSGALKASILSRLARINALKGRDTEALDNIDSAINAGYYAVTELDTVVDFSRLRGNSRFNQLRDKVFNSLYPCVNDPHTKEFDFWIGEWEVNVTGTNNYAGHSIIQKISGGCAIL